MLRGLKADALDQWLRKECELWSTTTRTLADAYGDLEGSHTREEVDDAVRELVAAGRLAIRSQEGAVQLRPRGPAR